jgi:serine/threonine protein kinase
MPRAPQGSVVRFIGNGRYVLGAKLGVGGMGVVYVAEDLARTERVAIKVAHGGRVAVDVAAEHMVRELRAGRAMVHPNVVRVLDGGSEAGRPFVVMELAPGDTLDVVAAEQRLSIRRAAAIVDQVLAGLAAIHDAGYVHGDLKTSNILVARGARGADAVTIIDLGLAREQTAVTTSVICGERVVSGTPQYLAPEVVRGEAKTVASELYAVGAILYELLTGTPPFNGDTILEILRKQVEGEIMPPSLRSPALKLSLALERVVLRALHKDPRERYASAAELRAALRAAIAQSRDALIASRVFSTTGPTMQWTRPELPPLPRVHGTEWRVVTTSARDPHVVVEAALDATRALVEAHRLGDARDKLETELRTLEQNLGGDRIAWRLLLPLAAICDSLREPTRARRTARVALDCAARAGSELGRRRAKALLERFGDRASRCA